MKEIAFYNGNFLNYDEATTLVEDRGNNFGDGVYDALSCFNGKTFNLEKHVDRFFRSMEAIEINSPYTKEQIVDIVEEAIAKLSYSKILVYFQMTRGTAKRAHLYPDGMIGNFYLVAREKPSFEERRKAGAKIISLPDDRWRRCDIKSINLLPNILAAKKASEKGCVEALLVREGNAAECTSSSAWFVKDGVVYTEPLSPLILKGISRTCIIEEIAPKIGIEIVEKHSSIEEFYNADEVFLTSCTKLLLPITQVDDVIIGEKHPIADRLFNAYVEYAEKQCGRIIKEKI